MCIRDSLYAGLKDRMDIFFDTPVRSVEKLADGYAVTTDKERYEGRTCVISVGRSGSKWMEEVCTALKIPTSSNRVDIGVRVEMCIRDRHTPLTPPTPSACWTGDGACGHITTHGTGAAPPGRWMAFPSAGTSAMASEIPPPPARICCFTAAGPTSWGR